MRKTILSVVVVLAFASCAFAQPTPAERMRTSTAAPNLSAGDWQVVPEQEQLVYHNQDSTVKVRIEYYVNDKEHMMAYLYVLDTNGNRQELSMLYGIADVARGAIKTEGAWHVSEEVFYDNGKENPKGTVSWAVIPDKNDPNKPAKARLSLETVDGPKELTINLQ